MGRTVFITALFIALFMFQVYSYQEFYHAYTYHVFGPDICSKGFDVPKGDEYKYPTIAVESWGAEGYILDLILSFDEMPAGDVKAVVYLNDEQLGIADNYTGDHGIAGTYGWETSVDPSCFGKYHKFKVELPGFKTKEFVARLDSIDVLGFSSYMDCYIPMERVGSSPAVNTVELAFVDTDRLEKLPGLSVFVDYEFVGVTNEKGKVSAPIKVAKGGSLYVDNAEELYGPINGLTIFAQKPGYYTNRYGNFAFGTQNTSVMFYPIIVPVVKGSVVSASPVWGKKPVTFVVYDRESMDKVAGAEIFLNGSSYGRTDDLGLLELDLLGCADGVFSLEAEKSGFIVYDSNFYCGMGMPEILLMDKEGACGNGVVDAGETCETCPSDAGECLKEQTPCNESWPAHEGDLVSINEENYACDLFEVASPVMREHADQAIQCCSNACPAGCNKYCSISYSLSQMDLGQTQERLKVCAGAYTIFSLGPAREIMNGYFWPELCCAGSSYCKWSEFKGKCGAPGFSYNYAASSLECKDTGSKHPVGWVSDTDMSKNSCVLSDLPPHASADVINTGTCADYSTTLTTLLRLVGFKQDEVYTVYNANHAYNLVKFSPTTKWHVIDTTGNNPTPYMPGNLPRSPGESNEQHNYYCTYDRNACINDGGTVTCPSTTDVWGC